MRNILYVFILVLLTSCYREVKLPSQTVHEFESLSFVMADTQINNIHNARDISWELFPEPSLFINNHEFQLSKFSLRGESTLDFQRKSFSVNLKHPFFHSDEQVEIDKFKLLSMVYDYTYIENYLGTELMRKFDLWPLLSFYTEVNLNGTSEGLYYFVEAPDNYCFESNQFHGILRRGYHHGVSSVESTIALNDQDITNRFSSIYSLINDFEGEELYIELNKIIDLKQYFRFMAINYIICNGDYTDEVYFYLDSDDGELGRFNIMAWDLDDLFVTNPHEIGRSWAVGNVFGNREYTSKSDIINDVGNKFVFSIEDDLDYVIAKDSFLYSQYYLEFKAVINAIDDSFINDLFSELDDKLFPFYENENILLQSQFDVSSTSLNDLVQNIDDKKEYLLNRIQNTKAMIK